jgi:hypothetical protein
MLGEKKKRKGNNYMYLTGKPGLLLCGHLTREVLSSHLDTFNFQCRTWKVAFQNLEERIHNSMHSVSVGK